MERPRWCAVVVGSEMKDAPSTDAKRIQVTPSSMSLGCRTLMVYRKTSRAGGEGVGLQDGFAKEAFGQSDRGFGGAVVVADQRIDFHQI